MFYGGEIGMICKICGSNVSDGAQFCPNCGAPIASAGETETPKAPENISQESTTPMMEIPMEEAPEYDEMDPESGTTVLTYDMSGPLTADQNTNPGGFESVQHETPKQETPQTFSEADGVRQHQPQVPEGKVVTPAPVTGSSILSDASVMPKQGFEQNPQGQPAPQQMQSQGRSVQQQMPPQGQPMAANPYMPNTSGPLNGGYPQQGYGQGYGYSETGALANNQNNYHANGQQNGSVSDYYQPISPWGYVGYTFLFSLPIVGLVLMFIWGFGEAKSINLKNFARSYLIMYAISLGLTILMIIIMSVLGVGILGALSDY